MALSSNTKYTSFQQFVDSLIGLLNIAWADFPAAQKTGIRNYYNNNAQYGWIQNNWLPVCPNGEARFVGNQGFYPNDLSKTSYWTATNVTVTANNLANPADGRVTASKLAETVTNGAHNALQSFTYIPNATYQVTCYARALGGRYLYLSANDGVNTYSTIFNLAAGTAGTSSNNLSATSTIQQTANGFWICNIFFTAASTAGAGNYGPGISSDGTTISYAGDTSKGLYVWGNVLTQTAFATPSITLIPNNQLGESFIDATFQVWQTSPVGAGYPCPIQYEILPDGVQVIGVTNWVWNGWLWTYPAWFTAGYPVYLFYRTACPSFTGTDYSAMATYSVDDQILFTNSASVMNFWKCVIATTAGQSPDTNPNSWELIELPQFLFNYVLYKSFADYLRMDAQMEKAQGGEALAQQYLDMESDKQERQQGHVLPMHVATHMTQSPRGYFRT